MPRKQPILVALDLETTGLHPEQDSIIEVAAIKFRGNTVLDTFETFVAPERPLPYRVQRLTGITPQQLAGAPAFLSITGKLQAFVADFPLVGHSIPFDVGFLRRQGLVQNNALIDTFELATVLMPSLSSYSLDNVALALGVHIAPGRHRAMVDTALAMDVFLALHERLKSVDLSLLEDMAKLDAPRDWPLLAFFRQELRERQDQDGVRGLPARGSLGDHFAAQLGMDPRILSFAIARAPQGSIQESASQGSQTSGFEPESESVSVAQMQKQVEVFPEQSERPASMGFHSARIAVRETLAQVSKEAVAKALLMEVTLGDEDYTLTLLPVLEWLTEASDGEGAALKRIIIACANQQNARYLIETVLPRLQASLQSFLPVAYLAERNGYFCVHRWFGAALKRTKGELTAEEARGLAKLGLWAQQTLTGERSEITLLPQENSAWDRISSGVERIAEDDSGSAYERCVYRRKGYCFVSRAEERIKAATIVVTTHAGLLDDLSAAHSLLRSIDRRLILDADLLEDEIARWSSADLEQLRLINLLRTIGTELPNERFQGLLALAAPALRDNGPGGLSRTPTIANTELDSRMRIWFQTLQSASVAVEALFASFASLLEEFVSQNSGNGRDKGRGAGGGRNSERSDQPLRLIDRTRNFGAWARVERSWQHTMQRLLSVIDLLHEAEHLLLTGAGRQSQGSHRQDIGGSEERSIASELAAVRQQLSDQIQLGRQALALNESEMVYWLRIPTSPQHFFQQTAQQRQVTLTAVPSSNDQMPPVLYAQLAQIPNLLKRLLLTQGSSSIFAGVSLSVDSSFVFNRSRFGLDADSYPAISVVTDHSDQTLLYLPSDVPEPNMPQYQRHLDEALINLASSLDGQLVALFTSHAALRSSYSAIKPILEARGILVLGHGIDGSPRQLWQVFSSQERVVLLGTGFFWDSIGEVNRVPTCTVITRLPMPVLNDPPIAARAEHISDQLHQITIPLAALRLRRSLSRLAWSDGKRNAIILFDRRVISKEYGPTILHSLPHCSQREDPVSHMPETILDWLTSTGAWK
jgi:ATP-dependent DNA helicase DinG